MVIEFLEPFCQKQAKYLWYSHQIPTKVVVRKAIVIDLYEPSFIRNFNIIYYLRRSQISCCAEQSIAYKRLGES